MKATNIIYSLVFGFAASLVLVSCSPFQLPQMASGTNSAMRPILEEAGLTKQFFDFDARKGIAVKGAKGTLVHVPANCFVSKNGKPVENVILELVEAPDRADALLLNYQTTAGDELIETDGVFFLSATTANGEELEIVEGKNIDLELPADSLKAGMQSFLGTTQPDGTMNWDLGNAIVVKEEAPAMGIHEMIPIPLELFPHKQYYEEQIVIADTRTKVEITEADTLITAPSYETLVHPRKRKFYKGILAVLSDKSNAGTYIATREFAERLHILEETRHDYAYMDGKRDRRWHSNTFSPFQEAAFETYVSGKHGSLEEADMKVHSILKGYVARNTGYDSFGEYQEACNQQLEKFHSYSKGEGRGVAVIPPWLSRYATEDMYEQLRENGLSSAGANYAIDAYVMQQEVIAELKGQKVLEGKKLLVDRGRRGQAIEIRKAQYYFFEVSQLGWVNCDRFINEPNAKAVDLVAEVNDAEDFDFLNISLVLNEYDAFVSGYAGKDGKYHFTTQGGNYRKLPIGTTATVLAIGSKGQEMFLAKKDIVISADEAVDLNMKGLTKDAFKQAVREITNEAV